MANSAQKFEKQMQKMMIKSQKELTQMQIKAQKEIQKMSNETSAKTLEFNKTEAEKARKFNSEEAAISRDWQFQMSNTAHQREVADLKKAGLNPVLSASGGGGAASYTTSSASAQNASASAENPSNAIASMMSGLMGSISALSTSMMSSSASRYSADQNLAAARTSAAATKYAADRSYAAQVYSADKAYQTAMEKPASNLFSILDKYLGKKTANTLFDTAKDIYGDPTQFFGKQSSAKIKKGDYKLTKYGYKTLNKALEAAGIEQTYSNRRLLVSALAFGDKKSAMNLKKAQSYSYR